MNIGTLTIEMAANVARLSKDMDAARRTVERTFGSIEKDVARLKGLLGGLFAGLSASTFVGKLVDVQRQFDVLNSSLITVTGSSAAAAREFAWIKQFAATTPFQLAEVTSAFVKMKALGLDASQAALASYGNTASAMGKSLNQMIEAVADAATGEFERLKEFGIKAKQQGDQVTLTFQGVSKTIGNNAAEITAYLQAIGENEFAGAMAQRAQTLDGAISNLADTWDELFRTISQQSAGGLIYDSVKLASGAIEDLITILNALNGATAENAKQTGAMKVIQEGIAIVFETVAVLGVNLKYVLVQIGREIGGIAAQAAAILRGDFAQAGEIRRMMVADAEAARREVDATTARILNARSAAQAATAANVAMAQSAPPASRAATTVASSTKKANDELEKFIARMNASEAGVESDFYKNLELLRDGYNKGKLSLEEYMALAEKYIKQQKFYQDQVKESAAAEEERRKAVERATQEREKAIQSAEEMVEQIQFEIEALKMTNTEREIAIKLRELERKGIKAGSAEYEEYARRIREAVVGKEAVEASIEQQRKAEQEWQKTWDQVGQSLTDALMRGFESGKGFAANLRDTVVNMFKTMVLRPVIQAVVAPVAGGITSALGLPGVASAAGTVGQVSGGLSGVSGIGNLFSGISTLSSALGLGLGAGFSSIGAAGIGGWLSAGTSLIGTGTLGGIGAGLGLLAGPVGGALAIGGVLSSLFGDDDKPRYKFLTNSGNTNPGKLFEDGVFVRSAYGNIGFHDYAKNIDANEFQETFQAIAQLDNAIAATLSPSENDRIRQALDGYESRKNEAPANYVVNRLRIITDTVGGAIDQLADQFDGTSEEFVDYVYRLVQARSILIPALQDLGVALDGSSTAAMQLALTLSDAFGGAQNAAQALAGYFQNYYTEAERVEVATRRMREAFAAIGVEMPQTRDAFRALVEAQDLSTESGRAMYAALMQLQGAFAELTAASDGAAADVGRVADEQRRIAEERARLEQELLRLLGNTAELRRRELESLDASNRGLQQQIWALEDARQAQEEYNRALEDARSRFSAAKNALAAAQDAVDSVRNQATSEYLAAQERVMAAQQRIADILREQALEARRAAESVREMGRRLREFVQGELAQPTQIFADTLRRALAGDQAAMQALPDAARSASEDARRSAVTSGEARVAQARIMAQVLSVARQADGTPLPDVPGDVDPLVQAQQDLARAQSDLANALRVANQIGASLTPSINDLVAQYNAAVAELARAQAEYAEAARLLAAIEGNTGQIVDNTAGTLAELDRVRSQIVTQLQSGFTKLDTNLDGLVNTEEFLTAFGGVASEATLRALYAEIDINGDQQISLLEALQTGLVGALAEGFTRIDTSLNGLVDINEFISAFGGVASENTLRQIFAEIDINGDQQISQFESLRNALINALANGFNQLDTSVDALITFEEFKNGLGGLASEATLQTVFRELDVNSDGFISRLESIRLNTAATVSGLSNLSTGATQKVTFADNDPIRSVFNNISRTNELLIDGMQLQLMALRGQVISETLQPIGAQDSLFIGIYTLIHQTRNYLRDIATYTANTAFESRQTNLNLLNVMSGAQRFWVRGSTSLFAKGGVFTNRVVDGATPFDMGVMGEAGPEAIMPLKRMPDGTLGVVAVMPDWSRYGRFDNADVVSEIRALRSENAAQARALVQLQQRMTKIIERWDGTGLPEERVLA